MLSMGYSDERSTVVWSWSLFVSGGQEIKLLSRSQVDDTGALADTVDTFVKQVKSPPLCLWQILSLISFFALCLCLLRWWSAHKWQC